MIKKKLIKFQYYIFFHAIVNDIFTRHETENYSHGSLIEIWLYHVAVKPGLLVLK